jgi:hypothetical protein
MKCTLSEISPAKMAEELFDQANAKAHSLQGMGYMPIGQLVSGN